MPLSEDDREAEAALRQIIALEELATTRLRASINAIFNTIKGDHPATTAVAILQSQVTRVVLDVRSTVRDASRSNANRRTGKTIPQAEQDEDFVRAGRAANFYTKAWTKNLSKKYGGQSNSDIMAPSRGAAFKLAKNEVDSRIDRIASYEVASAWNSEQARYAPLLDSQWAFRWYSQRDFFTCKECKQMNRMVSISGTFPQGIPPLHADCRCTIHPFRIQEGTAK